MRFPVAGVPLGAPAFFVVATKWFLQDIIRMEQKITQLKVKLPVSMPSPENLVVGTRLVPDRLSAVAYQFFLAYVNAKRKAKRKDGKYLEPFDWFTVNSRILKAIGSCKYSHYVAILTANRIIEARLNEEGNASYLPGQRSKQYRFIHPQELDSKLAFREHLITDPRTIKSILAMRDAYNEGTAITPQGNPLDLPEAVIDYLVTSLGRLQLDINKAQPIIQSLPGDKRNFHEHLIDNLSHHFVFDSFGYRLHSWLTNLNKKLRKALKFEGEGSLCIIDIANSQPYFASIVLQRSMAQVLLPQEYPVIHKYLPEHSAAGFIEDCVSGYIYDSFASELKVDRDKAKILFFQGVMYRNRVVVDSQAKAVARMFKKKYPKVDKLFTRLRNLKSDELEPVKQSLNDRTMKSYHKFRKHKLLPLLMQRAESRMMFNFIIPALMEAGIGPVVTIHDSFIVPARFLEKAILIIEQSFKDIGIEPPTLTSQIL